MQTLQLSATTKGRLAEHKRAVHEGVKYPCGHCNYKATTKGSLAEHKRAVNEGVKYLCQQCNYHATSKCNLGKHNRGVHEEVKYPCNLCSYQATKKGPGVPNMGGRWGGPYPIKGLPPHHQDLSPPPIQIFFG